MVAAVGAGASWAGIFHVLTHAFFKALLFLGAGSVIHSLGGEQDVRKMGGLGRKMRVTGVTALIATLAIAGVPFLSGYFSKDAILGAMLTSAPLGNYGGEILFALLMITAGITAFYMFRWYYLVFAGQPRSKAEFERAHESPSVMTVPLVLLAIGSVIVGYVGLPAFLAPNWIQEWLAPVMAQADIDHLSTTAEWLLLVGSVLVAAIGLGLGYWLYAVGEGAAAKRFGNTPLAGASRGAFGIDTLYRSLFIDPGEGMAEGVASLDRDVVDRGLVGVTGLVPLLGRLLVGLQTGYVRAYALAMLLGVAALALIAALIGVFA
jgi:NADH-quinone oxidoreductase subunit L